MKLSAYIIRFDAGFAPNPFGHHCTLACCKPTIRRKAEVGDLIVATASSRLSNPGNLVYAMRVNEVITYQQYWDDSRFARRKPSLATPISRRGDNIWHRSANGNWQVAPNGFHNQSHVHRDTSGQNVLIANEFFYFGREAIAIPAKFWGLLATTQGHKNTYDRRQIERFWHWLAETAPKLGRIGYPTNFDGKGCCIRCKDIESRASTQNRRRRPVRSSRCT